MPGASMDYSKAPAAKALSESVTFPSGRTAANRLAKAPLEELLAKAANHLPNESHFNLYRHWARGGWGMVITGNVCIDRSHLGTPFDVALEDPGKTSAEAMAAFKKYAQACKGLDQGTPPDTLPLVVVQLVHAGRQSMRGSGRPIWKPSLAPSAVPVSASESLGLVGKGIDWAIFGTCEAMTKAQITELIERFAAGAATMHEAGFDGVELHGSHGYQLAAFLSPRTNKRTDEYGGDARGRIRIVLEIIDAVRNRVPRDFVLGIKLNSADFVRGGLTENDALLNVQWLAEHGGIDFVEISGGNYENVAFLSPNFDAERENAKAAGLPVPSKRTVAREAFFQGFAQQARQSVVKAKTRSGEASQMKLYLTGGLKTRKGMASPVQQGIVDGVAIGRYACVYPSLPETVLNAQVPDESEECSPQPYTPRGQKVASYIPLQLIGAAGWTTLWHDGMLAQLARNEVPNVHLSPSSIVASILLPVLLNPGGSILAIAIGLLVGLVSLLRLRF